MGQFHNVEGVATKPKTNGLTRSRHGCKSPAQLCDPPPKSFARFVKRKPNPQPRRGPTANELLQNKFGTPNFGNSGCRHGDCSARPLSAQTGFGIFRLPDARNRAQSWPNCQILKNCSHLVSGRLEGCLSLSGIELAPAGAPVGAVGAQTPALLPAARQGRGGIPGAV